MLSGCIPCQISGYVQDVNLLGASPRSETKESRVAVEVADIPQKNPCRSDPYPVCCS